MYYPDTDRKLNVFCVQNIGLLLKFHFYLHNLFHLNFVKLDRSEENNL